METIVLQPEIKATIRETENYGYRFNYFTLTFGGGFTGSSEIWQCGIHFGMMIEYVGTPPLVPDELLRYSTNRWADDNKDAIDAAITNYLTYTGAYNPDQSQLNSLAYYDWFRVSSHNNGKGETIRPSFSWIRPNRLYLSGNAGSSMEALAVTLVSDRNNPPGRFNRFFLPASFEALQLSTGQADVLAVKTDTFISELNRIADDWSPGADFPEIIDSTQAYVAIVSDGGKSDQDILWLNYPPARTIWVGLRPDTQRRRKNRLWEDHEPEEINNTPSTLIPGRTVPVLFERKDGTVIERPAENVFAPGDPQARQPRISEQYRRSAEMDRLFWDEWHKINESSPESHVAAQSVVSAEEDPDEELEE